MLPENISELLDKYKVYIFVIIVVIIILFMYMQIPGKSIVEEIEDEEFEDALDDFNNL